MFFDFVFVLFLVCLQTMKNTVFPAILVFLVMLVLKFEVVYCFQFHVYVLVCFSCVVCFQLKPLSYIILFLCCPFGNMAKWFSFLHLVVLLPGLFLSLFFKWLFF